MHTADGKKFLGNFFFLLNYIIVNCFQDKVRKFSMGERLFSSVNVTVRTEFSAI